MFGICPDHVLDINGSPPPMIVPADMLSRRVENFAETIRNYQLSLIKYHEAMKNKVPRHAAKKEAEEAFERFQKAFRKEISTVDQRRISKSPLKSFKRATGLVRGNPNFTEINIGSVFEASWLAKLARFGICIGTGLAVFHFGSRATSVAGAAASGDKNWEREMFIESSSFAASATTGLVGVQIGGAALAALLAATTFTTVPSTQAHPPVYTPPRSACSRTP
jgi:hypothetical protein